jgi:hypothetical protein
MTAPSRSLTLSPLHGRYTVLRFLPEGVVPAWTMRGEFFSVTRSKNELSVVTNAENLPIWQTADSQWHVLKVHGPFAFTEIGVLASRATPLAKDAIGIFVVSTFDTDYLLVQVDQMEKAIASLQAAGHKILDLNILNDEMKESEG